MDKMTEKVGIYDLWTVFFPGTIEILGMMFCYHIVEIDGDCNKLFINWKTPNDISSWVVFILLSYFVGIILQEIGRKLRKLFRLDNATEGLLSVENRIFTKHEIEVFTQLYMNHGYKGKTRSTKESKRIFRSINTSAQEQEIADRYVKLNVLQNMSLSLAVVMLIEAVVFFIIAFYYLLVAHKPFECIKMLMLCVTLIFLFIVFLKRSERFDRYWVRNIVYSVYKWEKRTKNE